MTKAGKRLLILLLPLLLLLAAVALLRLYATPIAHWTAAKYLENFDFELRRFDRLELRLDGLDIAGLTLAREGLTLDVSRISADFALPRLEKIEVDHLHLTIPKRETGGGEPVPDAAIVLQTLHELPVRELEVAELRLAADGSEFHGSLRAFTAPLRVELDIESPWPLSLQMVSTGADSINAVLDGPGGLQAEFEGSVFDDGTGFAAIDVPEFRLSGENPMSSLLPLELFSTEPLRGDLVAGAISGAGSFGFNGEGFEGGILFRLEDLSGYFAETAFFDLDTVLEIELTPDFALRNAAPLEANLARVDSGLPLEDLRWNYEFDSASGVLEIHRLQAALLGGTVSLPTLRLDRGQLENLQPPVAVNLVLSDVDLALVTGLADYDELAVTGRVSGYLPLRVGPDGIRIEDGLIGALQPGGTIRYTPQQPASDPRMQTVNELLSDYRFETLNSYVRLDESGELLLQTEITGTNPTVNPGQPINLNVNISDNIPELLRSLRAGREISRVLEEQLNRQ